MRLLSAYITVVLLSLTSLVSAQQTTVVGYVRSKIDKLPVVAANVYVEGTITGTQTDDEGFFFLRHNGPENKLVFSSIGYKTQVLTIRAGETMSVNIELKEDIRALQELFVYPGVNPATLLMKKVREAASANDIHNSSQTLLSEEEELVLMSATNYLPARKFRDWTGGLISSGDSSEFLPLYVASESYLHQGRNNKKMLDREASASPDNLMMLMEKTMGNLKSDINFYNNNLVFFDKNLVSPLSPAGNSFYMYYLSDSISDLSGKKYKLRFRSRNQKNLAFNGEMFIDSASLAISSIDVQLPGSANLNYITGLHIHQQFEQRLSAWIPAVTRLNVSMNYNIQLDSLRKIPGIYINRIVKTTTEDSPVDFPEDFAGSGFQLEELELKLAELNDLPVMKAARWIADVVITGYAQAGKVDIGKVYQFARLTDQEGLRVNVPLRTNELLSPSFSLGGYWGYGIGSGKHYFSVNAGYKLPFIRKTVFKVGYTDDLRRTDYEYNDYMVKENPLLSGDVDIANTLISFTSSNRLNKRKEWFASVSHDWNNDIELSINFRSNRYFESDLLPFSDNRVQVESFPHHSVTLVSRFSSGERTYEDHLERIYVQNELPVVYLIAEGGRTVIAGQNRDYGKFVLKMKQRVIFPNGQWLYSLDAGWLTGKVPYNLRFNQGSGKAILHRRLHFNLMNYMEYTYDRYLSTHQELMFNGILFNSIPGVKNLNLRELITVKAIIGDYNNTQPEIFDRPGFLSPSSTPYVEVGAGITNIFRVASVQSVWRLTDRNKPGVSRWGIVAGVRFNF